MEKDEDPYGVLGVPYDASEGDIKKAYRKAALKYHPDRQETDDDREKAHDIFAKISEAYATLTDPVKRYDWRMANESKMKGGEFPTTSRSTRSSAPVSRPSAASRPSTAYQPRPSTANRSPMKTRSPKRPTAFSASSHVPRTTSTASFRPSSVPFRSQRPGAASVGRKAPVKRAPPVQTFSWARNNANGTTTNDSSYTFAAAANAAKKKSQPSTLRPGNKESLRANTMHGTGTGNSRPSTSYFNKKNRDEQGYSISGKNGKSVERMSLRPPTVDNRSESVPSPIGSPIGPQGTKKKTRTLRRGSLSDISLRDDERTSISSNSYQRRGSQRGGRAAERQPSGAGRTSSSASPLPRRRCQVEIADITRTPRTGRKRTVGAARMKAPYDPLQEFNRIVRTEFGNEYVQNPGNMGMFKSKNIIAAKPLGSSCGLNAVLSVSTKTQTEKQKDGKYQVKTVTKITRADGSVEKNAEVSVVDKEEAKKIKGQHTECSIERKIEGRTSQKKGSKKGKKKVKG